MLLEINVGYRFTLNMDLNST